MCSKSVHSVNPVCLVNVLFQGEKTLKTNKQTKEQDQIPQISNNGPFYIFTHSVVSQSYVLQTFWLFYIKTQRGATASHR